MAEDDAIMKTRLLMDGDGVGDERRINSLIRQIIKFADVSTEATPEETRKAHDRITALIAQCEAGETKSHLVRDMNERERANYEKLYGEIEGHIDSTKRDIKKTKEELVEARRIRANRMEYDALAKELCKNPDRATTSKKLEELDAEIKILEGEEEALDAKLETRKKQFHGLVHTIHQLQALLEEV